MSSHPSSDKEEAFLEALAKLAEELGCRGTMKGEPPLPQAKKVEFGEKSPIYQVLMNHEDDMSAKPKATAKKRKPKKSS